MSKTFSPLYSCAGTLLVSVLTSSCAVEQETTATPRQEQLEGCASDAVRTKAGVASAELTPQSHVIVETVQGPRIVTWAELSRLYGKGTTTDSDRVAIPIAVDGCESAASIEASSSVSSSAAAISIRYMDEVQRPMNMPGTISRKGNILVVTHPIADVSHFLRGPSRFVFGEDALQRTMTEETTIRLDPDTRRRFGIDTIHLHAYLPFQTDITDVARVEGQVVGGPIGDGFNPVKLQPVQAIALPVQGSLTKQVKPIKINIAQVLGEGATELRFLMRRSSGESLNDGTFFAPRILTFAPRNTD